MKFYLKKKKKLRIRKQSILPISKVYCFQKDDLCFDFSSAGQVSQL